MTRKTALTPDEVRRRFRARGATFTQWAKERGYDREAVYRVLNGKDKAHYGRAHEIAVSLGLKVADESVTADHSGKPSTLTTGRNAQLRKAG